MRNDEERREFIHNSANWKQVDQPIADLVRLMSLEYLNHVWYKVEVLVTVPHYDIEIRDIVEKTLWVENGIFKLVQRSCTFESISYTNILNDIKSIDKELKNGKKQNGSAE